MTTSAPAPWQPVDRHGRAAAGAHGVVSSARLEASRAGLEILEAGGNAVDAIVATGFALGVVEPAASGLGGGGFMTLKLADSAEAVAIDFRETAPAAATADMYLHGARSDLGAVGAGVPGETAGLLHALEHYGSGRLTRAQVMAPAIALASGGYPVTPFLAAVIRDHVDYIRRYPAGAAIYLKDGQPPGLGDTIRNPDLARVLELVAEQGAAGFYQGALARRLAEGIQRDGGIITVEDLAGYQVRVRPPVAGTYRGHTILSVPPASSGGAHLVQLLNIMETFDLAALGWQSAAGVHLWAEALKLVFADRARYMGDTDFVRVPLAGLTAKGYARELAARIDPERPMDPPEPGGPERYESGSTTSCAAMDAQGNLAALTKSINHFFSGVVVPGLGFIMNTHMDDFVTTPGSANSIAPGKRPLSSISPTLVLDPQGRAFLTVGSPGATRIFSTVAQVISNVVDFGMPLQEAIAAPRFFRMHTGELELEGRVSINTFHQLRALGHDPVVHDDWDFFFGGVHAVLFDHRTGILTGGADPRRDGQAVAF
ncbi:MAG: gamma-glutamyltransferase [Holophaga sp.]|jgi:gamma-glutamyltranspeptidase/glutathione hydrolase